ncbi:hypothetical protein CEXT_360811 [Caerostris extrusa]|uniref:Uncharacterized protein n=1 Tax=Caerostris extrusa TaxID=172846 RepID=A0AAV4PFD5_CAEEX|nr:hypothetical protein CEXT_360811 [Caerostris extrusa]
MARREGSSPIDWGRRPPSPECWKRCSGRSAQRVLTPHRISISPSSKGVSSVSDVRFQSEIGWCLLSCTWTLKERYFCLWFDQEIVGVSEKTLNGLKNPAFQSHQPQQLSQTPPYQKPSSKHQYHTLEPLLSRNQSIPPPVAHFKLRALFVSAIQAGPGTMAAKRTIYY